MNDMANETSGLMTISNELLELRILNLERIWSINIHSLNNF
jgi:hypothetical protein